MTLYRVILAPDGRADIRELHGYIAKQSCRETADRYISRIRKFYQGLALAPHRGQRLSDRPGLRIIGFEHRVTIVFSVSEEDRLIQILGFRYDGRQI